MNVCIRGDEKEHNKKERERESIERISIHTTQAEKNVLTTSDHIE
jgi:hypothetical protein